MSAELLPRWKGKGGGSGPRGEGKDIHCHGRVGGCGWRVDLRFGRWGRSVSSRGGGGWLYVGGEEGGEEEEG